MQRSPPADRHGATDKESFRRPWVIHADPSTVTTESKVMNLSEVKEPLSRMGGAVRTLRALTRRQAQKAPRRFLRAQSGDAPHVR
jgi:hypothetical protein